MFSDCFITSWKVRENAKLTWERRHTGWLLTLPGKPGNPGKGVVLEIDLENLEKLKILEKGVVLEIDLENLENNIVFSLSFLGDLEDIFYLSLFSFLCANSRLLK